MKQITFNKLLVIIAVIFILVFGFEIYQLYTKKASLKSLLPNKNVVYNDPNIANPTLDALRKINPSSPATILYPTIAVTPVSAMYDANGKNNPINVLFFNDAARQFPPGIEEISEGMFTGKVIDLVTEKDNYYIVMESLLKNGLGKTVWYMISKYNIEHLVEFFKESPSGRTKTTLADVKKGAMIDIIEKNNYGKPYQQSVISISIIIK